MDANELGAFLEDFFGGGHNELGGAYQFLRGSP
jgi:hypothetical protein